MAKIKIDFSGTEESFKTIPVGSYLMTLKSVEQKEGNEYPYLSWTFAIATGMHKGLQVNHITSLSPKALFSLRDTLEAFGATVPKSALTFDPDRLVGKQLGAEIKHTEKDGNTYANVKKVFTADKLVETTSPSTIDEDDDDLGTLV